MTSREALFALTDVRVSIQVIAVADTAPESSDSCPFVVARARDERVEACAIAHVCAYYYIVSARRTSLAHIVLVAARSMIGASQAVPELLRE